MHPWRHHNVPGVTARQARHNPSTVGGVTAGQVRHNSSSIKKSGTNGKEYQGEKIDVIRTCQVKGSRASENQCSFSGCPQVINESLLFTGYK